MSYLRKRLRGITATIPATTYTLSGPAGGDVGVSQAFTLTLGTGFLFAAVIVTPDDGADGAFVPASVTLTNTSRVATFGYTPASPGTFAIATTNDGDLVGSPDGGVAFVATSAPLADGYTLAGPSTWQSGSAATYAVTLGSGTLAGTATITPGDGGAGGIFSPTSVSLTNAARTATFTYTQAAEQSQQVTTTNNAGLVQSPTGGITLATIAANSTVYNFDSDTDGQVPAGFTRYASGGGGGWATRADAARATSGANCLAYAPTTGNIARAWVAADSADVELAANVRTMSGATQLIIRGANLGGTSPTYLAVEVASGSPVVRLWKCVAGIRTQLAAHTTSFRDLTSFAPYGAADTQAFQVTIAAKDDNIRVAIRRNANNLYYADNGLYPDRRWLFNIYDPSVLAGTLCGVGISGGTTAAYVDDIAITSPSSIPSSARPTIAITSPAALATLALSSSVAVTAAGGIGSLVRRVAYTYNGVESDVALYSPWGLTLDSRRIDNGPLAIKARVYDANENWQEASVGVTVANSGDNIASTDLGDVGPFEPLGGGRRLNWFNLTTPIGSDSTYGLSNATVIDSGFDLDVNPSAMRAFYTNLTNIYATLLLDWNLYADANGHRREAAFLHNGKPITFTQNNQGSTRKSQEFWSAMTKVDGVLGSELAFSTASALNSTTTGDVVLGGSVDDVLYLGYPEPFDRIRFLLTTAAAAGWQFAVEYATAVDGDKAPTTWAAAPSPTDGTSSLTASGTYSFVPLLSGAGRWVASKAEGGSYLHWARIRTTHAGTAPTLAWVRAHDFTGSGVSTGTVSGCIAPAFDFYADADEDGYLNPGEYANRRPGYDAYFAYQGRYHFNYWEWRPQANPGGAAYRAWAIDYHQRALAASGSYVGGLFLDNAVGKKFGGAYQPYDAKFADEAGLAALVATLACKARTYTDAGSVVRKGWHFANTLGAETGYEAVYIARNPSIKYEQYLRPIVDTYSAFSTKRNNIAALKAASRYPARKVYLFLGTDDESKSLEKQGTVANTATPSSTQFAADSAFSNTATYAGGSPTVRFLTGDLAGQVRSLTGYTAATRLITASAFAAAPAVGDVFVVSGTQADGTIAAGQSSVSSSELRVTGDNYQDRRIVLGAAAYYLLINDPDVTGVLGFDDTRTSYRNGAIRPLEYDCGTPAGAATVFNSAPDPSNTANTYTILVRFYGRDDLAPGQIMVLHKFMPVAASTLGDASATSHDLLAYNAGGYNRLTANGDVDPDVITSISLRNGEGAILIPA